MQTHPLLSGTVLQIPEPPIARLLFADTRLEPLRVYRGCHVTRNGFLSACTRPKGSDDTLEHNH